MKNGFWILIVAVSLVACNDSSTTISVKGDSIGRELDTLGEKIEEKAEQVGDSVKATYKDIKESVKAQIDSIKAERRNRDTTD